MSSKTDFRVVHVFPNSARLSCGPCNAVAAFMECQLQYGLDVRSVGPLDEQIPANRRLQVDHLPLREFKIEAGDFIDQVLAEAGGKKCVFHFHGLSPWSDRLADRMRQAGQPYVFTSHGQLNYQGFVHGLKKCIYLNFVNPFIRRASGLHFLTLPDQQRFRFILPFRRHMDLVQPNLVSLPDVATLTASPRAEFDLPPDAFVFTFLGRLDIRHKGLDVLIDAFAQMPARTSAYLVLIGPDFEGGQQILADRARQLGCESRIRFPGSLVDDAKWSALKMADAFVFPSRWEAFAIALVEAAGIGVPSIIADKIHYAAEMQAAGAALVSPFSVAALAQSMLRIREDAALRQSLAAGGRRWVEETCSSANVGPKFEAFYRAVAGIRSGTFNGSR